MKLIPRFATAGVIAVALLGLATTASAQEAPAPAAAPEEDHTADFKVLTTDFINLHELFAQFKDPVHKVPTSGYISLLKQRAVLLGWKPPEGMPMAAGGGRGGGGGGYGGRGGPAKIQFDQVKYDELRYDINLQYQRIATYLAPLRTPLPPPARTAIFDLQAISPNPANPAEVKAALDILDHETKRMENRIAMMAPGAVGRDDEVARLTRIKERRVELGKQFTAPRWDQLLAEFGTAE